MGPDEREAGCGARRIRSTVTGLCSHRKARCYERFRQFDLRFEDRTLKADLPTLRRACTGYETSKLDDEYINNSVPISCKSTLLTDPLFYVVVHASVNSNLHWTVQYLGVNIERSNVKNI